MGTLNWHNGEWRLDGTTTTDDKQATLATLRDEYKEVSQDWRLRDKYVEDKFIRSVFFFSLLTALVAIAVRVLADSTGASSSGIPSDSLNFGYPAGVVLFGVLGLFAFVMLISLVKDTYYRDGSERMARLLIKMIEDLGGTSVIGDLRQLAAGAVDDGANQQFGPFTRKIKTPSGENPKLGMPLWLEKLLSKRKTFRWITAYYLLITLACFAISLISLYFSIWPPTVGS